jgi:hypothetical protein
MASVIVDTFDNIVNPHSEAWSKLREDGQTYRLDQSKASAAELQYYELRNLAHKQGLTEEQFVGAVKSGRLPQFASLRGQMELKDRRQRARDAEFPLVEEFVLARLAARERPPSHVLERRLQRCGLSTRGSQSERWNRLREHVYRAVSSELLRFALHRERGLPREQLLLKSKRELFALWHEQDGEDVDADVDVPALLDAWQHYPSYEARAQEPDVSDLALESGNFELTNSVRYALRPQYLHAVTRFYGLDSSELEDYDGLLTLSRALATRSQKEQHERKQEQEDELEHEHDDEPQHEEEEQDPHWPTVLHKLQAGDVAGAMFSSGTSTVAELKRRLRQSERAGKLAEYGLDSARLEKLLETA